MPSPLSPIKASRLRAGAVADVTEIAVCSYAIVHWSPLARFMEL